MLNTDSIEEADIIKHIERCGRVCYKSEDKITKDSGYKFVNGILKSGHESVIEHGVYILKMGKHAYIHITDSLLKLRHNGYIFHLNTTGNVFENRYIVSGNIRAWRDYIKAYVEQYGDFPFFLKEVFIPNKLFEDITPDTVDPIYTINTEDQIQIMNTVSIISKKDLVGKNEKLNHHYESVLIVCDRGISHEVVRSRLMSYSQVSTRYVNYNQEKYDNQLTFILPCWCDERMLGEHKIKWQGVYGIDTELNRQLNKADNTWFWDMAIAERDYNNLIKLGWQPQQARDILPNSLQTEIVVTGNLKNWLHFFELRTAVASHPQIREIAIPLFQDFKDFFYED